MFVMNTTSVLPSKPEINLAGMRLRIWHWGTVVSSLESALHDWYRLGAIDHSPTARLAIHTYDAARQRVYAETLDVAWIKLGHGAGAVELICPVDSDPDAPQMRLLKARSALSHVAVWCDDLIETAECFIADGATLVIAPLLGTEHVDAADRCTGIRELLSHATTCYLQLTGGLMVELNPTSGYESLAQAWSRRVHQIIDRPLQ